MVLTERRIRNFWAKVSKSSTCWVWTGSRSWKQYGRVRMGSHSYQAHRVSWEMVNGPIEKDLWVLHRCDNPPCVNPAHLFLGTNEDNIKDKLNKKRHTFGDRHPHHFFLFSGLNTGGRRSRCLRFKAQTYPCKTRCWLPAKA